MNSLCQVTKLSLLRKNGILLTTAVRNAGAWNKDWKPGPYPKTEEERIAAAKKYGLHPKDYKPYPDDGTGFGDYPMFDPVSFDGRDPYEHYDCPEFRRNFGEVIHVHFDMHTGSRVDCNKRYRLSLEMMLVSYISIMAIFFALYFVTEKYPIMIKPVMNPQYPGDEKINYTFESVE